MPKHAFQTWSKITMPEHRDPYEEFIDSQSTLTTINEVGERVPIQVEKQCVFGCGHCGIVAITKDGLQKVQCQIE